MEPPGRTSPGGSAPPPAAVTGANPSTGVGIAFAVCVAVGVGVGVTTGAGAGAGAGIGAGVGVDTYSVGIPAKRAGGVGQPALEGIRIVAAGTFRKMFVPTVVGGAPVNVIDDKAVFPLKALLPSDVTPLPNVAVARAELLQNARSPIALTLDGIFTDVIRVPEKA